MYVAPKRCPRCRYERQPSDTAPDWQCPSCAIAYHKAEAGPYLRPAGDPLATRTRTNSRTIWLVLALALVGAYGLYLLPERQADRNLMTKTVAAVQPEVVMYAASWCGYCAKARAFFARHGIDYIERDVERDAEASQINTRLGGGGVPTILVGEAIIHGFDEQALSQLLDSWMK